MLHSFFDNTISVKREAQKAAYLLNDKCKLLKRAWKTYINVSLSRVPRLQ